MFNASKAQADADTGKPAAAGAGAHARAGQAIRGNLYRGSGGQFQAGPGAQLQARVAAIRAKRLGKGKGKGKAKGKAPKTSPEQQQATNRAATFSALALPEDAVGALDDLAAGTDTDDDGGLVKLGLAETDTDGKLRLTSAGHAVRAAANRGDLGSAKEALSKAKDARVKKQVADKAKADRIAERAKAKQKKAKAKPKKEAKSPTEKKKDPAANRAAVTDKMMANDTGLTKVGMGSLSALADGDAIDESAAEQLSKMGLVERDSEGKPRATAQGRALLRAADAGDYGMALETISRAKDAVVARAGKEKEAAARTRATSARDQEKTRAAAGKEKEKAARDQERARSSAGRAKAKANKEKSKADTQRQTVQREVGAEVARRRQTATKAQTETGVMIALFVPNAVAQQLASIAGVTETASAMHITLAYLGKDTDVQLAGRKDELFTALTTWAATQPARLTGAINGVGRFLTVEDDGTNAVYVAPDVPGLIEFRQSLVAHLASVGFQYAQNHGYTPHITVAYVAATRSTPTIRFEPIPITCTRVALAWGDERLICPLGGEA